MRIVDWIDYSFSLKVLEKSFLKPLEKNEVVQLTHSFYFPHRIDNVSFNDLFHTKFEGSNTKVTRYKR